MTKAKKEEPTPSSLPGVGLDLGTMNIVSARRKSPQGVRTQSIRDAFLDLDQDAKRMLRLSQVKFIEREDDVIVVGDDALQMAAMFDKEARRPLSAGLISSSEVDSLEVLGILVRSVLGEPIEEDEVCYFSVPASPIDSPRDTIYHRKAFERIVEECGFVGYPSNEAMAIIYAEAAKDGFSGIGISFGSGMTNVALSVKAMSAMEFSLSRGGDWIDKGAAQSVGATQSRMCTIKEKGLDLMDPSQGDPKQLREREALTFYYQDLIDYALQHVAKQFKAHCKVELSDPIPLIVSGGTSLAKGFLELFEKVFKKHRRRFPIKVSEIRQASDPLSAVAHGLLVQAMQEYEE